MEVRKRESESLDCSCAGSKFPEGSFQLSAWKSSLAELFETEGGFALVVSRIPVGAPVREAER